MTIWSMIDLAAAKRTLRAIQLLVILDIIANHDNWRPKLKCMQFELIDTSRIDRNNDRKSISFFNFNEYFMTSAVVTGRL